METRRLGAGDREMARSLFVTMADVFEEEREELSDEYLDRLLGQESFWALAAVDGEQVVGGLTAHVLPMTRTAASELFIYDIAVRDDYQRQGVGRRLVADVRAQAAERGIPTVFVLADTEDLHALDFYRAVGGTASAIVAFTFT